MKVFVALPVFNLINPKIKDNHNEIFSHSKNQIVFSQVIGASPEHARSILINRFLETDCTHYFTLDADILYLGDHFDPIDRLVSFDKDIIGGLYFYKKKPCLPVFRPLNLQEIYEKTGKFPEKYDWTIPNDLFEVNWLGNGFKMVKRSIIKELREKYLVPNLPMIHKGEYVSEDYAFDERARELGYSVWIDPSINLGHMGEHVFQKDDFLKYNNLTQ